MAFKILVKRGVVGQTCEMGFLYAPQQDHKDPLTSALWFGLLCSAFETERWKEWANAGITNLQALTRYREHGSSVAKSHFKLLSYVEFEIKNC
eukprot:550128-Amphidinium_carterae.2